MCLGVTVQITLFKSLPTASPVRPGCLAHGKALVLNLSTLCVSYRRLFMMLHYRTFQSPGGSSCGGGHKTIILRTQASHVVMM